MSEVKPDVKVEEKQEEAPNNKEYSPIEQKALDMGWRPREEYAGEDDDFVDAKEFVGRKPFFDQISTLKRELRDTSQATKSLMEHNARIEEAAYTRALKKLKEEQKKAVDENDMTRYHELQEEIDDTKEAKQTAPVVTPQPQVPQAVQDWIGRNTWYSRDSRLRMFADAVGVEANRNGLSGDSLLNYIETEVKKEFPQKFTNPNRNRPSAVEGQGAGRTEGSRERGSDYTLNEQEKRIMENLVKGGTMTKAEYVKQLKQAKGEE